MRSYYLLSIFLCILIPVGLLTKSKNYTLLSDGKTEYVIVVSAQASRTELFAASELQKYIKEASGAELPIVDCDGGKKGRRIIIGYNRISRWLFRREKVKAADDESFTYKNNKGDIVIIGGSERGTMYGVFSFLENELGCRWLAQDCTIIPKRSEWVFSQLNHSETPAFARRSMFYSGFEDPLFRAHGRVNEHIQTWPSNIQSDYGESFGFLSPHTMGFLLPINKYFSKHPEYYALVNGKHLKNNSQPCFTNEEVFQICVSEIKKLMRDYPTIDIFEVSALDNRNNCQCEKCQNAIEQLGSYTDLVLDFVNRIADTVKDEFPSKRIEFLAYSMTATPPLTVRPRDNVVVRLCNINTCHVHGFEHCKQWLSVDFLSHLQQWRAMTNELYIWEYASSFMWFLVPLPNFYALRDNLISYKERRIEGVFIEGNHYSPKSELQALRIYVMTKLLWNPNCNIETVINDFISGYYGTASPYMRQYFDLLHTRIRDDLHISTFPQYSIVYYTEDLIQSSLDLLDKAKKVADNEAVLRRVEFEEMTINFLKTMQKPDESKNDSTYEKARRIMEREKVRVGLEDSEANFQRRILKYYNHL